MIPKELDHEDGELTATQKLKRSQRWTTCSASSSRRCIRNVGSGWCTGGKAGTRSDLRHRTGGSHGDREVRQRPDLQRSSPSAPSTPSWRWALVLIYKATQILNFAHGALAAMGAYFAAYFAVTLNCALVDGLGPAPLRLALNGSLSAARGGVARCRSSVGSSSSGLRSGR